MAAARKKPAKKTSKKASSKATKKATKKAPEQAAAAPAPAPEEAAIAVVERFLAALEAFDLEGAMALVAPDAVYQNVPAPPDRGAARIRRTLGFLVRYMDHFQVDMLAISARAEGPGGDGVAVLTERVDYLGIGGQRVAVPLMGSFRVKDGAITAWRDYFDWASSGWGTLRVLPRIALRRLLPG